MFLVVGGRRLRQLGMTTVHVQPTNQSALPWGVASGPVAHGDGSGLYVFLRDNRAADFGIPAHDIVVDPLVMPVGAMATAGLQVFALVRRLRDAGTCVCLNDAPPAVAWSPDGRWLAYRPVNGGMAGIHPDGSQGFLSIGGSIEGSLAWQPVR